MRELVADDGRHALPVGRRAVPWIVEEIGLSVGDEAPVLHGARDEVGDGDHVLLRKGVGNLKEVTRKKVMCTAKCSKNTRILKLNLEVVLEEVSDVGPNVKRVLDRLLLIGCGVDAKSEWIQKMLMWTKLGQLIDSLLGFVNRRELLVVSKITDDEAGEVGHHGHGLLELKKSIRHDRA